MHTASPSVLAMKLRERTPAGQLVTLHFSRRMCSRWFVEALVSIRIRMRSEQAVSCPCPNRERRDAKSLGHLLLGQEALAAQSVIATLERIVILDEINDHLPCKQSPVAGVGFQKDGTLVFQNLSPLSCSPRPNALLACPTDRSKV
jgi:hypothetical protein